MKLYTWKECPLCVTAKEIIKNKSLEVEKIEIDMNTRQGRDEAMRERIMGVPVLDTTNARYIWPQVIEYLESL